MRLFRLEGERLYVGSWQQEAAHVMYIVAPTIAKALKAWHAPGAASAVKIEELCSDVVIVDG